MRTISAELQAHLDSGATTTTYLLRVESRTPGFNVLGITLLDEDVVYDDGDGEITYLAAAGMVPENLATSSQMDVDNTQIQHLFPESDLELNEKNVNAGVYDFAWFTLMLVNYEDLTMGHVVLQHGQLGQLRVEDGLTFWTELMSLSKMLKQSIVKKDSITCRATFGSQPPGTVGATYIERQPCGFDAESLYVDFTVSAVGLESTRTFNTGLAQAEDFNVPGMIRWVTGDNAGREYEIEDQEADGTVSVTFETMFPIQVGDTGKIRPDCTKWKDNANGCKSFFGSNWVLHYRGEPYIPISDADAINTPGATVGAGLGGSTS